MGGLVEFSTEYAWVQKQLLSEMAMPYAIADSEGHLIWMNSAFGAVVKEDKSCRKSLTAIFPDITKEILEDMEERSSIHSSFDGKFYRVDIRQIYMDENESLKLEEAQGITEETLLAIYLFDETEVLSYKREKKDEVRVLMYKNMHQLYLRGSIPLEEAYKILESIK